MFHILFLVHVFESEQISRPIQMLCLCFQQHKHRYWPEVAANRNKINFSYQQSWFGCPPQSKHHPLDRQTKRSCLHELPVSTANRSSVYQPALPDDNRSLWLTNWSSTSACSRNSGCGIQFQMTLALAKHVHLKSVIMSVRWNGLKWVRFVNKSLNRFLSVWCGCSNPRGKIT